MTIRDWVTTPEGVSAIAVGVTALVSLIALGPRFYRWSVNVVNELRFWFRQQEEHRKLEGLLHQIISELQPNGGGSLRDSVNRIEDRLDFLGSFRRAQLNTDEVALVETDATGRVTWANKRFITLMNVTENTLLGSGWVNVIHPEQRDWVYEHWHKAVEANREFRECIRYQPHPNPDGPVPDFYANVICHPVRNDDGKLFGYLAEVHPCVDTPEGGDECACKSGRSRRHLWT